MIIDEGFEAQAKALCDFGYNGISADMIREAHRKWQAGVHAVSIIEMMSVKAFEDHPEIFGTKGQSDA